MMQLGGSYVQKTKNTHLEFIQGKPNMNVDKQTLVEIKIKITRLTFTTMTSIVNSPTMSKRYNIFSVLRGVNGNILTKNYEELKTNDTVKNTLGLYNQSIYKLILNSNFLPPFRPDVQLLYQENHHLKANRKKLYFLKLI